MQGRSWPGVVTVAMVLAAAACGSDGSSGQPGASGAVLVFAAASLADAFAEMESAFETANPGVDVQVSLAGSSTLREQILQGAPADVFASADESNMAQVMDAGDIAAEPRLFARNSLQIAVPTGNPGQVTGLADFADANLLIGLCASGVPCGELARQVMANAGVEASIDTNEPDVRALLTKIGADELDAGIVYTTDVTAARGRVEGIEIGADVNVKASYPIAQVAGGQNPSGAVAFLEFVLSRDGRAILTDHGFEAL